MRKIRVGRLRKLIRFLNQLEPKNFNFDSIANECGTVCCAIGWTYKIFPNLVEFNSARFHNGELTLIDTKSGCSKCYDDMASILFNLSSRVAYRIFTPNYQSLVHVELPLCLTYAEPKEVADMLTQFIQLVKENKIEGHCI